MANSLNMDLDKKHVVLSEKYWKGTDIERVFLCDGGFGTSSATAGQGIFGKFVFDGEETRVEGFQVRRLAKKSEIEIAEKRYQETHSNGTR